VPRPQLIRQIVCCGDSLIGMAGRDRTTLGISLIVAVLAMSAREYVWLQVPLTAFAVFLIVWGRESKRTEAFISRMPGGHYLQRVLQQFDLILSPRNLELEQHFRDVLSRYSPEKLRASLLARPRFSPRRTLAAPPPIQLHRVHPLLRASRTACAFLVAYDTMPILAGGTLVRRRSFGDGRMPSPAASPVGGREGN
jgi:hypothetical protein